jgi:RNA-binding protein
MDLTGKQKKSLRAMAHHLNPVVMVGSGGLSKSVIDKVTVELKHHELIKIKVSRDAPTTIKDTAEDLRSHAGAHLIQTIGRMVVLYKGRKKDPTIVLPKT